jgi:Asp-tRNA(Asn)/Glu-tRNA(Gln) amidotransferase B subunit
LRDAWKAIVSRLAESQELQTILADLGLPRQVDGLPASVRSTIQTEPFQPPPCDNGQQQRFFMGRLMAELRGRVPAAEVAATLSTELEASA